VPPLIFTPELCAKARGPLRGLTPLLLRWAGDEGVQADRIRDQIERAASLVHESKRRRVLGQIAVGASDDQVKAAVGGLLLAKMLVDQTWDVEFEPAVGTQTPDLRIRKPGIEYIVEIRRVVGRARGGSRERRLVHDALRGIRTATPLHVEALQVDGGSSLKPLVEHVKTVLAARPRPSGRQRFASRGVMMEYEISTPRGDEPIFSAVFGWPIQVFSGDDADLVMEAIKQKLYRYKQPIVVALDVTEVMDGFDDAVDALYGERNFIVPIHAGCSEPPGKAHLGPMQDGMLTGNDRDAVRVRKRLIAALPFSWGIRDKSEGFGVSARVLTNPAIEPPTLLEEFAPVPRFVVASRVGATNAMMRMEPANADGWWHVV
jgi:hypothetical protein